MIKGKTESTVSALISVSLIYTKTIYYAITGPSSGTPTREDLQAMNPDYVEMRLPSVPKRDWSLVFHNQVPGAWRETGTIVPGNPARVKLYSSILALKNVKSNLALTLCFNPIPILDPGPNLLLA